MSKLRQIFDHYVDYVEGRRAQSESGVTCDDWDAIANPAAKPLADALDSALAQTPNSIEVLEIAADFYSMEGDEGKAATVLECWAKADKGNAHPLLLQAAAFFGDPDTAPDYAEFLGLIDTAAQRQPESPSVWRTACEGAQQQGDNPRRLVFAGKLATHSRTAPHLCQYGIELGRSCMPEKAATIFRKALKVEKDHVRSLQGLGMAYLDMRRVGDAEQAFHRLLEVAKDRRDCAHEVSVAKRYMRQITQAKAGKALTDLEAERRQWQSLWEGMGGSKLTAAERKKRILQLLVAPETPPKPST